MPSSTPLPSHCLVSRYFFFSFPVLPRSGCTRLSAGPALIIVLLAVLLLPHAVAPVQAQGGGAAVSRTAAQPPTGFLQKSPEQRFGNRPLRKAELQYAGNARTKKYHNSSCRYFRCRQCTVMFTNPAEAEARGFTACKICGG